MLFSEILGQDHIKNHLIQSASLGRIPHAQLFVGPEGSGTLPMALAYARFVLCQDMLSENNSANASCHLKCDQLAHPDLHFIFPTITTDAVKSKPKSVDFLIEWRAFLKENPYAGLLDWYQHLQEDKKSGMIRVDDAQEALRTLSFKSFEGGYKVMILWMADHMNVEASNKLLKLIEEPANQTVLILIAEQEEDVLLTIRSRCQVLHFNGIPESVIANYLVEKHQLSPQESLKIAHQAQGNLNQALKIVQQNDVSNLFESWFVKWVRAAFRAKGNATAIHDLIDWSDEISKAGREVQKHFLHYCIEVFRQALLYNYQAKSLVFLMPSIDGFKFDKFAPFVNNSNIEEIYQQLSEAIYHIERNGNAKLILTDLSIKLTRLIHKK